MDSSLNIIGVGGMGANALNGIQAQRPDFLSHAEIFRFRTYDAEQSLFRGQNSAEEWCISDAASMLQGNMTTLIAGLGGKNGSLGIVALVNTLSKNPAHKVACFVSLPFDFEGSARKDAAQCDLAALLARNVLVVTFNNQGLFKAADEKATFADAFKMVDRGIQRAISEYSASGCVLGKSIGRVEWDFVGQAAKTRAA